MRRLSCSFLAAIFTVLAACEPAQDSGPAVAADTAQPAGRIDSILPMAEAVRRFREGLTEVTHLEGGATSRDQLVRDFVRAIESNDTTAIQRMAVSRAEYAYLYFPTSMYMKKPYEQAPALAWFLNAQNSEKGISRVMRRLGGHDLAFDSYTCSEETREGENTFWRSCTVTYVDPQDGARATRRLFGTIIARAGRHKFLSFANDF